VGEGVGVSGVRVSGKVGKITVDVTVAVEVEVGSEAGGRRETTVIPIIIASRKMVTPAARINSNFRVGGKFLKRFQYSPILVTIKDYIRWSKDVIIARNTFRNTD